MSRLHRQDHHRWRHALATAATAGVVGLAHAVTAVPTRLHVVDCFANAVDIDLASAKVLRRRSLAGLLPPVPPKPIVCLVYSPRWEDGQLAFDMAAGGEFDEDELHHRDVRIDLSTDRVSKLSDEHPRGSPRSRTPS